MTPESVEELIEIVQDMRSLYVEGTGSHLQFRMPFAPQTPWVSMTGLNGISFFNPDDQVVVVRAGTLLKVLQAELATRGHCLPMVLSGAEGTVGGAFSMNLPHSLDAECGSWRDWTLGLTVIRANGTVAKAGSMAVKNVAGYDVQKLLCGARGTLGIITELILKTFPIKSLPTPTVLKSEGKETDEMWIQRVLPTDFDALWASAKAYRAEAYPNSATVKAWLPEGSSLPRFQSAWVLRSGAGEDNLVFDDPVQLRFMLRAKEIFDPERKLNPGEMGVF